MRIKVVIKGGAVPPTDPVELDPTKPGEATASVQQLLPGCYSETGRIAEAGLLQPDMEDIPYPRLDSFLPYQRFQGRSPQIEFPTNDRRCADLLISIRFVFSSPFP